SEASIAEAKSTKVHAIRYDDHLVSGNPLDPNDDVGRMLGYGDDPLAPAHGHSIKPPRDAWQVFERRSRRGQYDWDAGPPPSQARRDTGVVQVRVHHSDILAPEDPREPPQRRGTGAPSHTQVNRFHSRT